MHGVGEALGTLFPPFLSEFKEIVYSTIWRDPLVKSVNAWLPGTGFMSKLYHCFLWYSVDCLLWR